MKQYRLALIVLFVVAVTGLVGCGSNNSAKTDADVYLSQTVNPGPAEVSVSKVSAKRNGWTLVFTWSSAGRLVIEPELFVTTTV